jgi:hypothetical protein
MSNIERRINRLEEILDAKACICPQVDLLTPVPIVCVEQDATPEEVEAAKAVRAVDCPVHDPHIPAEILVLRGSDRYC